MQARSNAIVTILVTCALTFGFAWFDLPGHGAAFVSQDATLGAAFMDGHALYLLGMFLVVVLEAAIPRWFDRHPLPVLAFCLVGGVATLAVYCAPVPLWMCAASVVATGFVNVLFLNSTATSVLIYVCRRGTQLFVIVGALAAKTLIVYFSDRYLEAPGQIALLIALPVLGVSCALVAWRFITAETRELGDSRYKFEKPLSTVMLGMLLLSSMIFATTRVVSNLGFWGTEYALSQWGPLESVVAAAVYVGVCYLTLVRADSRLLFRFLPALFLLFVLYAFLYSDIGGRFGLTDSLLAGVSQYTELYGQTFAWAVILLAIRTLKMPAPRVVGIQFGVFTLMELVMQRSLLEFSEASLFVVLLTFMIAFALLIWAQCHFYGYGGLDQELRSPEVVKREGSKQDGRSAKRDARIALGVEHGLSERETDVFLLLAQGRSRKFICDELFIADGTASSYISRVYEKFGVHSKQELLSLVLERTEREDAGEQGDTEAPGAVLFIRKP